MQSWPKRAKNRWSRLMNFRVKRNRVKLCWGGNWNGPMQRFSLWWRSLLIVHVPSTFKSPSHIHSLRTKNGISMCRDPITSIHGLRLRGAWRMRCPSQKCLTQSNDKSLSGQQGLWRIGGFVIIRQIISRSKRIRRKGRGSREKRRRRSQLEVRAI